MSISYGTITITDTTDLGQLSVYLTASTVRQQVYDDNGNTTTYYPNWDTGTSGTALVITPHVYFNGHSESLTSNKIGVAWGKTEGGTTYPYGDTGTYSIFPCATVNTNCPESVAGTSSKELQRPKNLAKNGTGATYTATITYYPVDSDRNITLQAVATLDLTIASNGTDGSSGAPAKSLQLIGDGSHFSYTWSGTALAPTTINLIVEKQNISNIKWYCDDVLISGQTADNLSVTTQTITNYSPQFHSRKSAQFKVVEADSSGNVVTNGFVDYFTIYKLEEARPGDSVYAAYLDNDEETVSEYNNIVDLTNAETTFFLTKNGSNELIQNSGWTLSVTDSNAAGATDAQKDILYTLSNVGDAYDTYLNHVKVDTLRSNTAWIEFTASKQGVTSLIKRFTITKNPQLISRALRLDSVNANRKEDSSYNPPTITIDAIERTGGGTNPYHISNTLHYKIYYTSGNPSGFISNTNGSALQVTLADGSDARPISYIETFLGGTLAQNYADAEDKQKITISYDGTDGQPGDSPWNFMISNVFDSISTDFNNVTSGAFTIKIPVKAAEGTILKDIRHGGSTYPTISSSTILNNSSIGPKYYSGETDVTNTTGAIVDNVRYNIPISTNIGATGDITLTLTYESGKTLTQTYTYNAQPEILKPVRLLLDASPSDTFENQEGEITITPTVLSGTTPVTSGLSNFTWEAFIENSNHQLTWTPINSTDSEDNIYLSGHNIVVKGEAVQGYLSLRLTVRVTRGGHVEDYTEYITLKDIDDPLQVTLHSTVGEQLVNGQGVGILYARVIRKGDNEDYDAIVPDDMLAVGTSAPTSATAPGKTGYFHIIQSGSPATPTGQINYYSRSSGSGGWGEPRSASEQKYTYTWYFRDSSNTPYEDSNDTPAPIRYAMNNNTQFVYISSATVNNKITAVVKVEL